MNFEIVKLLDLSGNKSTIYSVIINDEENTLFDKFLEENSEAFPDEVNDITNRISNIGHRFGAREQFFKQNEGTLGDGISALYDAPNSHLRLYCIRNGSVTLILGGGGEKPKNVKAFQEVPKLKEENYLLRTISKIITQALKDGDIAWSADGMELLGELKFETDENHE